jgi:hypothetical protein
MVRSDLPKSFVVSPEEENAPCEATTNLMKWSDQVLISRQLSFSSVLHYCTTRLCRVNTIVKLLEVFI